MPFSYVNDASDDSNEVCLHITYLFLKALVFVSHVFLLALLSHENLHSLPTVVSSVFSPESTPRGTQQSPLLYSANLFICAFFYLFIYCIVIANIIFFKSIAWNLLSQIPYSVSVSVSVSVIPFPFPDSGFRVLVLPHLNGDDGSRKTLNLEWGNGITERSTESNVNDRKLLFKNSLTLKCTKHFHSNFWDCGYLSQR